MMKTETPNDSMDILRSPLFQILNGPYISVEAGKTEFRQFHHTPLRKLRGFCNRLAPPGRRVCHRSRISQSVIWTGKSIKHISRGTAISPVTHVRTLRLALGQSSLSQRIAGLLECGGHFKPSSLGASGSIMSTLSGLPNGNSHFDWCDNAGFRILP
jgi:hypothetical protein